MQYDKMHSFEKIKMLLEGNNIILFGAGEAAHTTLKYLKSIDEIFMFKIDYIVDNSISKWNTRFITLQSTKSYDIKSPDYLIKNYAGQLIVISTQYLEEICLQLNSYDMLNHATVLFYDDLRYLPAMVTDIKLPKDIRRSKKPLIPKVIHYCWFGGKPMPQKNQEWLDTWHKFCPDYEIVRWDEGNYDYKKNEYMYEAYKQKKWGFVPDFARVDIIYNHGGIYLDVDVEIIKNIDDLLYQEAFMGMQPDLCVANGLGFGAVKYHPFIKVLMDDYDSRVFEFPEKLENVISGPMIQTETMKKHGWKPINQYQIVEGVTVYPAPVLGGYVGDRLYHNGVYMLHHYDASWFPKDEIDARQKSRNRRSAAYQDFKDKNRK